MNASGSAVVLAMLGAMIAETCAAHHGHLEIPATLLMLALVLSARRLQLLVLAVSGVAAVSLLPVQGVLFLGANPAGGGAEFLLHRALWLVGAASFCGCVSMRLRFGKPIVLSLLSMVAAGTYLGAQQPAQWEAMTLEQLEREMTRGQSGALEPWLKRAVGANIGPLRIRQFCKQAAKKSGMIDLRGARSPDVDFICDAVRARLSEQGAKTLLRQRDPETIALAVDLFAEAGQWAQAEAAARWAQTMGVQDVEKNLWRWKAVKGVTRDRVSSWDEWNDELSFEKPSGAERSALRITHAPGQLKQMFNGQRQRAIMAVTRYEEAFVVELPKPPLNQPIEAIALRGQARRGFALEVMDAQRKWHRYDCSGGSDGGPHKRSAFCTDPFGDGLIQIDESIPQPLRLLRLRGEFILSHVKARPRS